MSRVFVFSVIMVVLGGCATMPAGGRSPSFVAGSRVLAEYQDSGTWWAGTVSAVNGEFYAVTFDDQTTDEVSADEIEALTWKHGSPVTCSGTLGVIAAYAAGPRTITFQDAGGAKNETTTAPCYEDRNAG